MRGEEEEEDFVSRDTVRCLCNFIEHAILWTHKEKYQNAFPHSPPFCTVHLTAPNTYVYPDNSVNALVYPLFNFWYITLLSTQ
jgi:hypothetical protein